MIGEGTMAEDHVLEIDLFQRKGGKIDPIKDRGIHRHVRQGKALGRVAFHEGMGITLILELFPTSFREIFD